MNFATAFHEEVPIKDAFLVGERIYLRPLVLEDAEVCYRWILDPTVSQHLNAGAYPNTKDKTEEFIRSLCNDRENVAFAIVLKENDRYIGNTGLHRINYVNRNSQFGIVIGEKDCWDKGYGTEATLLMVKYAFDVLNMHRVQLEVFESNPRGIRCYEKIGFKREGVLREGHYRNGKYDNVVVMGILRDEVQPIEM